MPKKFLHDDFLPAHESGEQTLATAILTYAVDDWKRLSTGKIVSAYNHNFKELRQFFRSRWCNTLLELINAKITGNLILAELEKSYPGNEE